MELSIPSKQYGYSTNIGLDVIIDYRLSFWCFQKSSIFFHIWFMGFQYFMVNENIMSMSIIDLIKWCVKLKVAIKNIAINLVHCIDFDSFSSSHPNTSPFQKMFYTHQYCDQSFDVLKTNDYIFDNLVHLIITKLLLVVLMEVQKQVS